MRASTPNGPRRLMMTAFGWNGSGARTIVPRLAAKELARRGWDVTVFHAAVEKTPSGSPYEVLEWAEDGVRLIGVHNRLHDLFDLGNPLRELDDPPITAAFAAALDRLRPDVVHFHNLHNLGAALIDEAAARAIPAHVTTHDYWLICPRAYLLTGTGSICDGPGDGSGCSDCVGAHDPDGHRRRLGEIRARAERGLSSILAVSDSVRRTLLAAGYPAELVDVVRQAMPHETEIWERVGRDRRPGRAGERLTVAFLGSAHPHNGPQLLIEAAQRSTAEVEIRILGEVPKRFAEQLRALDRRFVVDFCGAVPPSEIGGLLRGVDAVALPSMWWDCVPVAAAECLAARTPLLVPRLGVLPDSIRGGVDGLMFDGLDADDLARRLDELASEPGLLERLQAGIEAPRPFSGYVDELQAYYAGERPGRVARVPSASELAVRWQGDHGLGISLSIINDRITERLPGAVERVARDGSRLDAPLPHAADVEVRNHEWPPDLRPPAAGRLALIQAWEFGAVPRDWLDAIERHVDEVWVPSEHVRRMYLRSGADPERVVVIPNGVDLDRFTPDPDRLRTGAGDAPPARDGSLRFLFVGGLIWRKGPDVLVDAWRRAFAGRDDVTLVLKDSGAGTQYENQDRSVFRELAALGEAPRIELIEDDLEPGEMAALYRSCDVLVHPYRGEGFAMTVLEAMACGLPVIVTGCPPTNEFCPPEAGWRIRAHLGLFTEDRVDNLVTAGRPWVAEPDAGHLVELLHAAAVAGPEERARRGAAGREAALRLSWDAVAARYRDRLVALAARTPRHAARVPGDPFPLSGEVELRVLATPAWRSEDRLGELLGEWSQATGPQTSACLYLLADPRVDGDPGALEERLLAAAASTAADLEHCAEINVLVEPFRADLDRRLHAAVDAYVPLHAACAGHARIARDAGNSVAELGSGTLAALLPLQPALSD
jgi:glycosyltransferase involved in cell wall biosynthesis